MSHKEDKCSEHRMKKTPPVALKWNPFECDPEVYHKTHWPPVAFTLIFTVAPSSSMTADGEHR